jgi:hypothetical protein
MTVLKSAGLSREGAALAAALWRALHMAVCIIIHTGLAVLLIWAVWVIKENLTATGDPKLFDVIPLGYVFDAIELGIVIAFFLVGATELYFLYDNSYRPALEDSMGGEDE